MYGSEILHWPSVACPSPAAHKTQSIDLAGTLTYLQSQPSQQLFRQAAGVLRIVICLTGAGV